MTNHTCTRAGDVLDDFVGYIDSTMVASNLTDLLRQEQRVFYGVDVLSYDTSKVEALTVAVTQLNTCNISNQICQGLT